MCGWNFSTIGKKQYNISLGIFNLVIKIHYKSLKQGIIINVNNKTLISAWLKLLNNRKREIKEFISNRLKWFYSYIDWCTKWYLGLFWNTLTGLWNFERDTMHGSEHGGMPSIIACGHTCQVHACHIVCSDLGIGGGMLSRSFCAWSNM